MKRNALPLVGFLLLVLLMAGCGGRDNAADDLLETGAEDEKESDDSSSEDTPDNGDDTDDSPTTTQSTLTTDDDGDVEGAGDGPAGVDGEEWDGFFEADDTVAVMGVAHDDVLNIRVLPGVSQEIVTFALPTEDGVIATGNAWMLPNSIWYEVKVDGVQGWASAAFLGFMGQTTDDTSQIVDELGPVTAETMRDLGEIVAATYASQDPESRVVQSVAPTAGDLGEVTFDVIGIGDDSLAGYRVHVFGAPDDSGEGFGLKSVETTVFCTRGLSGELCV